MSPLYTTQIPAVQTVADLCFTWLYSWTNCWCLSLEGPFSTPPPKPLNLTHFPWDSLNSALENSLKSQTEKMVVYWWYPFPFNSISEFCVFKTLINLVAVWSDYSTESVMLLDVGRRRKNHLLYPFFGPLSPSPAHSFELTRSSDGHPRGWTVSLSAVQ